MGRRRRHSGLLGRRNRRVGPLHPRKGSGPQLGVKFAARIKELGWTMFCRPCFAYVGPDHQHGSPPPREINPTNLFTPASFQVPIL